MLTKLTTSNSLVLRATLFFFIFRYWNVSHPSVRLKPTSCSLIVLRDRWCWLAFLLNVISKLMWLPLIRGKHICTHGVRAICNLRGVKQLLAGRPDSPEMGSTLGGTETSTDLSAWLRAFTSLKTCQTLNLFTAFNTFCIWVYFCVKYEKWLTDYGINCKDTLGRSAGSRFTRRNRSRRIPSQTWP